MEAIAKYEKEEILTKFFHREKKEMKGHTTMDCTENLCG